MTNLNNTKDLEKYKSLEITLNKKILWDFIWAFNNSVRWVWSEFESLKQYEVWDSVKSIDWKKSAKSWTIFTRNYEDEKNLNIVFIINIDDSINFGSREKTKLETLLETYYILAKSSVESGHNIWAFINNEFINFNNTKSNIIKIFNNIIKTSINLESKTKDFINSKNLKNLQNLKNNLIFYIDLDYSNFIKKLNITNNIIYINIFDNFENNLAEDKFTFNSWFLDIFTWDKKRLDYIKLRENKALILKNILLKNNIKYLSLDNESDIYLELFKMFKN